MKYAKTLVLGFLPLLLFSLVNLTGTVFAITESQMRGIQEVIGFCTNDRWYEQDSTFTTEDRTRIAALCNTSNAAELGAACEGDIRDLDSSKYYSSGSFFNDLCTQGADLDEQGNGAVGGNQVVARELAVNQPNVVIQDEDSPLNRAIRRAKTQSGCYANTNSSIPTAAICGQTTTQILALCSSGDINLPQYERTRDVCVILRDYYDEEAFSSVQQAAVALGQTGTNGDAVESCEEMDEFAWIGCPFLRGIDGALNWIQSNVEKVLTTDPSQFEDANVRSAWVAFRNISSILLIIVMLTMVISTALGFTFVDAYTIKKVLPRLVIAAIAIQLSWALTTFSITVINAIGQGMFGLMLAPFGGAEATDLPSLVMNSPGGQGFFNTLLLASVGAGAVALGFLGLLSLAFTTFLAVIIGFFVLVIRNMVIIICIIMAPIAIVSWITPGSNKVWNLWWDSFSRALLMFPLIMILFASGRILAWTTIQGDANGDAQVIGPESLAFIGDGIGLFIIVAAYTIPYFLIPFTLRFAGGLVATLGGFANDRSKGIFDRNKKFRQGQSAQNTAKLKAGNRFTGKGYIPGSRSLAKGFNRTSAGLGTGMSGNFGFGERGAQGIAQNREVAMLEGVMKSPKWNTVNQNDDALMAATYDNDAQARAALANRFGANDRSKTDAERQEARDRADTAVAAVQSSIGFGRPQALAAARQLVSTGTGYENLRDMSETLARASGGNATSAKSLAGFANSETKKVGRGDLAPSFGVLDSLVQAEGGYSGAPRPTDAAYNEATVKASRGQDAVTLLRGKKTEMQNLTGSLTSHLKTNVARSNDMSLHPDERKAAMSEVIQTAAQISQLDNNKTYASTENQAVVNAMLKDTDAERKALTPLVTPASPGDPSRGIPPTPAGAFADEWKRANPPPRDPRDPNLPS